MHPTPAYHAAGFLMLTLPQGTSCCRCRPCEVHATTIATPRCLAGRRSATVQSPAGGTSCCCCHCCEAYPATIIAAAARCIPPPRGMSHCCYCCEVHHGVAATTVRHVTACGTGAKGNGMHLMAAAAAWRASRWRVTPHGCCANGGRTCLEAATAQWAWQWSRSPAAW